MHTLRRAVCKISDLSGTAKVPVYF
nr:unnamed protein product [Callosobruchus analis]